MRSVLEPGWMTMIKLLCICWKREKYDYQHKHSHVMNTSRTSQNHVDTWASHQHATAVYKSMGIYILLEQCVGLAEEMRLPSSNKRITVQHRWLFRLSLWVHPKGQSSVQARHLHPHQAQKSSSLWTSHCAQDIVMMEQKGTHSDIYSSIKMNLKPKVFLIICLINAN